MVTPFAQVLTLSTVVVGATAFGVLADAASEGDGVTRIDPHIAEVAVHDRTGGMTGGAHLLTALGSEVAVSALALFAVLFLLERRQIMRAAAIAIAMAGSAAMTLGIKMAVSRDRPGGAIRLGPQDSTYSFPSGHTLNSAVLLGMVAVLIVPFLTRRSWRVAAVVGVVVASLGIGASRVYLGYHWATDVLASWALASAWVAAVILALGVVQHVLQRSGGSQVDRTKIGA